MSTENQNLELPAYNHEAETVTEAIGFSTEQLNEKANNAMSTLNLQDFSHFSKQVEVLEKTLNPRELAALAISQKIDNAELRAGLLPSLL